MLPGRGGEIVARSPERGVNEDESSGFRCAPLPYSSLEWSQLTIGEDAGPVGLKALKDLLGGRSGWASSHRRGWDHTGVRSVHREHAREHGHPGPHYHRLPPRCPRPFVAAAPLPGGDSANWEPRPQERVVRGRLRGLTIALSLVGDRSADLIRVADAGVDAGFAEAKVSAKTGGAVGQLKRRFEAVTKKLNCDVASCPPGSSSVSPLRL